MKDWVDYILRLLFYLIGKFLMLLLVAGLLMLSFLAAKDYMNVNVLISDGFTERANVILKDEDTANLYKIYDEAYLNQDEELFGDTYDPYIIRSFVQDVDIAFNVIMPWQNKIVIRVTEQLDQIDGEIPEDQRTDEMTEDDIVPPEWDNGIYDVTLQRYESSWKITDVELIRHME